MCNDYINVTQSALIVINISLDTLVLYGSQTCLSERSVLRYLMGASACVSDLD